MAGKLGARTVSTADQAYDMVCELQRLTDAANAADDETTRYHLQAAYYRIDRKFRSLSQDIQTAAFVLHRLRG